MKRFLNSLPYWGLLTLALVVCVHGFRSKGLGLIDLPNPPRVELGDLEFESATDELNGQVLDGNEESVSEALVMTEVAGEIVWDYTDALGHFSLKRVPTGLHELSVVRRKFAEQTFQVSTLDADIVLRLTGAVPPPPQLPAMDESDLEGEVVAAIAGRVLLDYEVQLIPVEGASTIGAPIPRRAAVAADRHFRFPALLHGAYELRVLPPWATGGSWPNLIDPAAAHFIHGPATKTLVLPLLSGELAGRLIDARGDPVQGALVRVAPANDPARPWIPGSSAQFGDFLVLDLPPGTYHLQVDAGQASFAQDVEVQASSTALVDVPPLEIRARE